MSMIGKTGAPKTIPAPQETKAAPAIRYGFSFYYFSIP